jgi:predicted outer membrane protein
MVTLASLPFRLPVVALAVVLCAGAAMAADPPATAKPAAKPSAKSPELRREGSLGKGTSALPILTKEQLRQCMAEQERIRKENAELAQAQEQMDKDRAEIERLGKEIEAEKPTVDTSNDSAVNAFNDRVRRRIKMIEDFKAAAPVFNQRVDKLGADRQAYAASCADRRFFEDDLAEIKAGK